MSITIGTDGYCELADVADILPQRQFTSDSKPSEADVEKLIKDNFYKMNDALRAAGYAVPLTNATDLLSARTINKWLAAVDVELSIAAGAGRDIAASVELMRVDSEAWFTGLREGSIQLASGDNPTYSPEGNADLANTDTDGDPDFKLSDPVL
jgi:hypothetical protein